jgi:hypothetical protein
VAVVDGQGVRGTVPQRLMIPQGELTEGIDLMFRPDRVYNHHYLTLQAGDQVLISRRRRILTPGEMAVERLTPEMLMALRGQAELRLTITPDKQGA